MTSKAKHQVTNNRKWYFTLMLTKNRYLVKSYAKRPMTINKNNISHFFTYKKSITQSKVENDIFRHKSSNLAF